jgi:hypothetical protein
MGEWTSTGAGSEWSTSRPCLLTPGQKTQYPLDRRLGGPKSRLNVVEKRKFLTLRKLELRPLCRAARSQSLYRLSYLGFCLGRWLKDTTMFLPRIEHRSLSPATSRFTDVPTVTKSCSFPEGFYPTYTCCEQMMNFKMTSAGLTRGPRKILSFCLSWRKKILWSGNWLDLIACLA